MVDKPFKLDTLPDLTRYVEQDSFQSSTDDKSGYDHFFLSEDSKTFFGFEWSNWYFVSASIPFGWKLSAYIYHSNGSVVSHSLRSAGIPCSLYIDDRHIGQLRRPHTLFSSETPDGKSLANSALFLACSTLLSLGYTMSLSKSTLIPSQQIPYLGFLVDSCKQAFTLLPHKKEKVYIACASNTKSKKH